MLIEKSAKVTNKLLKFCFFPTFSDFINYKLAWTETTSQQERNYDEQRNELFEACDVSFLEYPITITSDDGKLCWEKETAVK